jgi:hypothetical protein
VVTDKDKPSLSALTFQPQFQDYTHIWGVATAILLPSRSPANPAPLRTIDQHQIPPLPALQVAELVGVVREAVTLLKLIKFYSFVKVNFIFTKTYFTKRYCESSRDLHGKMSDKVSSRVNGRSLFGRGALRILSTDTDDYSEIFFLLDLSLFR